MPVDDRQHVLSTARVAPGPPTRPSDVGPGRTGGGWTLEFEGRVIATAAHPHALADAVDAWGDRPGAHVHYRPAAKHYGPTAAHRSTPTGRRAPRTAPLVGDRPRA